MFSHRVFEGLFFSFLTYRLVVRLVEDWFFVTVFPVSRVLLCSSDCPKTCDLSIEPLSVVITGMCYDVLATKLMLRLGCRWLELPFLQQSWIDKLSAEGSMAP